MGGIHLTGADEERMEKTMQELERLGVRNFNLCHCSGKNNMATGSIVEVKYQD
jgi:7,8-dihydropterin-6-yl-methyl-4-(beta-D-ribofuranosyl)aminobenzene 5'-phosphate synthase